MHDRRAFSRRGWWDDQVDDDDDYDVDDDQIDRFQVRFVFHLDYLYQC